MNKLNCIRGAWGDELIIKRNSIHAGDSVIWVELSGYRLELTTCLELVPS